MVRLKSRLAAFMRARRGDLSQQTFAKKIGVAQSTVMRIENEDQNVTLETLERLCRAFKCDVDELFNAPASSRKL
jgi:DNA-binding XRE family transcriptional regulator